MSIYHPCILIPLLYMILLSFRITLISAGECVVDHSPLPLITFDLTPTPKKGFLTGNEYIKMESVESTMDKLKQIKGKVAIVSISGPYRTGKSWFLTQLLPPSEQHHHRGGFGVGDTTEAHTQDVEVHIIPGCALIKHGLKDESLTVLYMDTPGLFSPDRADVFDSQLLALLNLISSVLMYNTMEIIDRNDIKQFASAMDTAFVMSFLTQQGDSSTGSHNPLLIERPHLLWLLQNFHLSLNGETPTAYIMKKFNQTDTERDDGKSYTESFKRFFSSIEAETFTWPTEHTEDINKLKDIPWQGLTKQYQDSIINTRRLILERINAKKVAQADMTGELLVTTMKAWIDLMKVKVSGLTEQNTQTLLNEIIKKQVELAKGIYIEKMNAITLPIAHNQLQQHSNEAVSEIVKGKESIPRYQVVVEEMVKQEFQSYVHRNNELWTRSMDDSLKQTVHSKLEEARTEIAALPSPFNNENLTQIETHLFNSWSNYVGGLAGSASSNLITDHERSLKKQWSEMKQKAFNDNIQVSENQCVQRGKAVAAYFTLTPWWAISQWTTSLSSFNKLIDSLQHSSSPLPPPMIHAAPNGVPSSVPYGYLCSGPAMKSATVQEQYDAARHAFLLKHRIRVFLTTAVNLVVYAVAVFCATRIHSIYRACTDNLLPAKAVYENEGHRPYWYLAFAVVLAMLGVFAEDSIWSGGLHWLAFVILLLAAVVGFKLRFAMAATLRKEMYNKV